MDVLESQINNNDPVFQHNQAHNQALAAELRARLADARQGGDAKAHQRHQEQGKLPVRDRLERLLDPGAPFLELSPLAAQGLYGNEAPGAGMITSSPGRQSAGVAQLSASAVCRAMSIRMISSKLRPQEAG